MSYGKPEKKRDLIERYQISTKDRWLFIYWLSKEQCREGHAFAIAVKCTPQKFIYFKISSKFLNRYNYAWTVKGFNT